MTKYRVMAKSRSHGTFEYKIERLLPDLEGSGYWDEFATFISGSTDTEELIENAKSVVEQFNYVIGEFEL